MKEQVEHARAVIVREAANTPAKVPVDTPEVVQAVQIVLRSLGYVEAGPPDGREGEKTAAAILDFRNRNNLPTGTSIDGDLLHALILAPPKVLPIEQVTATTAEIAPKVHAAKSNLWTKFWAKVSAIPALVMTVFLGIINNLGDAINALTPLKTFLSEWLDGIDKLTLASIAALLIATVSGLLWLNSRQTDSALEKGYRGGTVKNDNEEAA